VTKTAATVEEDEAKMIAAIDVRRMNNGVLRTEYFGTYFQVHV